MKTTIHLLLLLALATPALSQTAESLKGRIQEHYRAINAQDSDEVLGHHLEEFTHFPWNGGVFWESGSFEMGENMGFNMDWPPDNVVMRHFNAQIHGNVGIATFYLEGNHGDEFGTWRVTAVWVWENGAWMEAHHHESELEVGDD